MAVERKKITIRGELNWCKLVGEPRLNEFSGEKEWSVDVTPDAASRDLLRSAGIDGKLREPNEKDFRKETFLTLRQRESREDADGNRIKNHPVRIRDIQANEWPEGKLIGNGSVGDIQVEIADYGKGKPKGVYIKALRVLRHVPYEVEDFAPLSPDDEFFADTKAAPEPDAPVAQTKKKTVPVEELDDEIPFDIGD